MDTIAKRLKFARDQRGMTQETLAKESGVKQSDISKIERGKNLRPTGLLQLSLALRCNPIWLDRGDGEWDSQVIQSGPPQGAKSAAGLTGSATELALLFDLIPETDPLHRSQAFGKASQAILDVLQEMKSSGSSVHRHQK